MNKEQEILNKWFQEQNWEYWSPHEILARLMEEVGEFSRLINHEFGPKKKKNEENKQELSDEIGDIIYTLACFANSHNINLDKAFQDSIEKVKKRDKTRF